MGLDAEQTNNANLIIQVGKSMGVPTAGLVIAVATAMQESSLRNLNYGDRDSLGLFQQRPSQGWGTVAQIENPTYAATKFYSTLLQVSNWQNMAPTQAAQAVQGSAFPDAYAQWVSMAQGLVQQAGGNTTQATATDAAGVSMQNSSVSAYQAANPTLSIDALRSQSPLVAALVSSVPELQQIFQQAVSGQWTSDKFISAVQNSNWWATHSDTARQAFATMQADPASWNQQVTNLQSKLQDLATQYGAVGASGQQIYQLAIDALTNGYDGNDATLRQKFEQFIVPVSGLHFGGEAGSTEDSIRQAQNQLGVFLPENQLDSNVQQITGGQMSVNDVTAQLRSLSENMYPAYRQQIQQGMDVSDIASPYIQRAQQLLEGGDGMVNIQSPLIKQALQYTAKGVPTPMPLGDFETKTRQDPRWLATDNAQNDMMTNAHKILTDFGLTF